MVIKLQGMKGFEILKVRKNFFCDKCSKKLASISSLKRHMNTHTFGVNCPICFHRITEKIFENHLRLHLQIADYINVLAKDLPVNKINSPYKSKFK